MTLNHREQTTDMGEFAEAWTPLLKSYAKRQGLRGDAIPDSVQSFYLSLMEKQAKGNDKLAQWDEEKGATWSSYIHQLFYWHVRDYFVVLGKRQAREKSLETLREDSPVLLLEDETDSMNLHVDLERAEEAIANIPVTNTMDLGAMFEGIQEAGATGVHFNYAEYARSLGISRVAAVQQRDKKMIPLLTEAGVLG